MADYQSVEIKGEETPAFTEEQIAASEPQAPQESQTTEPTPERPDWLPEKFQSPEALAYAYTQLEKEFSQSRNGEEASTEETTDTPTGLTEETFDALTDEFNSTGDVSEMSRERLSATGIPREFIDEYVEGQKQLAEASIKQVYDTVGGEESYKQMLNWAATNLPESEVSLFNDMVAGSKDEMMMAINGLYARYTQSGQAKAPAPTQPLVQGDTGNNIPTGSTFQSRAQVVEAMNDPRYTKDPAYREEVYRRLQNSNAI